MLRSWAGDNRMSMQVAQIGRGIHTVTLGLLPVDEVEALGFNDVVDEGTSKASTVVMR